MSEDAKALVERLSALFESPLSTGALYMTEEEELDAVASGKKALSLDEFWRPELATNPRYAQRLEQAKKRGLAVVELVDFEQPRLLHVYVARADETWRALAHDHFRKVMFDWEYTDATDATYSWFLGYTKDEFKAFRERYLARNAGWTGVTAYMLLPQSATEALAVVARRCLPREVFASPLPLFYVRGGDQEIMRDAWLRVDAGRVLARVALEHEFVKGAFKHLYTDGQRNALLLVQLGSERLSELNEALKSRVQILGLDGWT